MITSLINHNITTWWSQWLMFLNLANCESMHFSRPTDSSTYLGYVTNNNNLEYVTSYKNLRIQSTNNLLWHTHIENIPNHANRSLGYIRRIFFFKTSCPKITTLFRTLIRPKLVYACSVWDPGRKTYATITESFSAFKWLKLFPHSWRLTKEIGL